MLSPSEAVNLHGTTTTCSTTDDILLMEAQQQNGHSSLHSDLYGSFKGEFKRVGLVSFKNNFRRAIFDLKCGVVLVAHFTIDPYIFVRTQF